MPVMEAEIFFQGIIFAATPQIPERILHPDFGSETLYRTNAGLSSGS
jgi:hypothetical protein